MSHRPPDLLSLLSQARRLVPDDRYIWCCASDTFESKITTRRGLLLGGSLSPHFLRDHSDTWSHTPWTVRMLHCRVAVCSAEVAQQSLTDWLPALEGTAKAGESFLVIAESLDPEVLRTFVVNLIRGTLTVCAVRPARTRYGHPEPGLESLGRTWSKVPPSHDAMPRIAEAWVRRSATALFPAPTDPDPITRDLADFALIETGGENHEDQYERLRFLMRELQQPA